MCGWYFLLKTKHVQTQKSNTVTSVSYANDFLLFLITDIGLQFFNDVMSNWIY